MLFFGQLIYKLGDFVSRKTVLRSGSNRDYVVTLECSRFYYDNPTGRIEEIDIDAVSGVDLAQFINGLICVLEGGCMAVGVCKIVTDTHTTTRPVMSYRQSNEELQEAMDNHLEQLVNDYSHWSIIDKNVNWRYVTKEEASRLSKKI